MMLLCSIVLLVYALCIGVLIYGFFKVEAFKRGDLIPETKFSIVVPFRNEAGNLPFLLESFSKLDYPPDLFEAILVNDDSDDGFEIGEYGFTITVLPSLRISRSPKKDAIKTAIAMAKNPWIITTDADCTVNPKWLTAMDNCIQAKNPEMIAGAVKLRPGKSLLLYFQQLDLAGLLGATIGSFGLGKPFMCNGANFAYSKKMFHAINGFEGNDSVASGDDVFLLQKAVGRFPDKVFYLKSEESTVLTKAAENWKQLFYQRVRWAAKTGSYESLFAKSLGAAVFSGNLAWIIGLLMTVFQGVWLPIAVLLLLKITADFILIALANEFLQSKTRYFVFGSLVYPFFSVAVVMYAVFGKYEWKGRMFRK